jgi:hypothetical protein
MRTRSLRGTNRETRDNPPARLKNLDSNNRFFCNVASIRASLVENLETGRVAT